MSLVLRGSPNVSEAKRRAVQQAINELGYRPNLIARTLSERRTNMVGVLLNDLRNPWFVDCLEGLTQVLHAQGLRTMLADGRLDRRTDESLLQAFLELRVDGLVLLGSMPCSPVIVEATAGVPTVVAASRDIALPHVDVVANDDRHGTELAVSHLLELGHTRIAHLAGTFGAVAEIRRRGYLHVMDSRGLAGRQLVELCDGTEEGGYRAAIRLLTRAARPTAIFAVNDIACIGAMSAARELGLRIPQDVSLIGYDNLPIIETLPVRLTTLDIGLGRLYAAATAGLLARLKGGPPVRESFLPTLVPGETVRLP